MKKIRVNYLELKGSHREMGEQTARMTGNSVGPMKAPDFFTDRDLNEALGLYEEYCPGILNELEGFSEESQIPVKDIAFTWMTYLIPGCSSLALGGGQLSDGHTRLVRNYEFNPALEDLAIVRTLPEGKYAHIGGSACVFGRSEGINEWGLAVSMSSCGMPVGNMEGMRKPAIRGLQFWAVIRTVLENCKNTREALQLVRRMPIAYNINLYLADSDGNGVLFETMNGESAYETVSETTERKFLCGTNHIVIPTFQHREPTAMRNSVVRLDRINRFMAEHPSPDERRLRNFLTTEYPGGMSARYHEDFFGTIKSVIMDTVERRFSICWFGQTENGWEDFLLDQPMKKKQETKSYEEKKPGKEFFERVPLSS